MIVVAGAGMAGLVAAARLRELGCDVVVREKGTRIGGSMLLSSCVIWRHRNWETSETNAQQATSGSNG